MDSVLDKLGQADPMWLWLAALGFATTVLGAAGSWRAAIALCGGRTSLFDACTRFGAGSLVNTFVPARAGDAVRIGLFRKLVPDESLLATGGAFTALGAARALVVGCVVVAGALAGAVPFWPLAVAGGMVASAAVAAVVARRRTARFLDAFRGLGARSSARLVGWLVLSTLGRLLAATAIGAALHIRNPLAAAIIILPALDVAGIFPITPGNIGLTTGAVALALKAHGTSFHAGLAAGVAFHGVETGVGLLYGLLSVVWLTPRAAPVRRVAFAASAFALVGAFGATVLVPLV